MYKEGPSGDQHDEPTYHCRSTNDTEKDLLEGSLLAVRLTGIDQLEAAEFVQDEIKAGRVKETPSEEEFKRGFNTPRSLLQDCLSTFSLSDDEASFIIESVSMGKFSP